jgi:hypothetical protein
LQESQLLASIDRNSKGRSAQMTWLLAYLRQILSNLAQLFSGEQAESKKLDVILANQEAQSDLLRIIVKQTAPPPPVPTKMELQFQGEEIGMPGKETDTQTIPCSALETDAQGQPVVLNPASVTWAIDDPTIASMVQNADGSATFKALKIGTANVSCTDNSVTPPLVGTDTLTVTAGVAIKLALQFGTPA